MGRDAILEKLHKELEREIHEECQVVYILSCIRKILDMNEQKEKYKFVRFYCNWVLHNQLDRPSTTVLVSDIFDQHVDKSKNGRDIARKIKSSNSGFFKLNYFKDELQKFLEEYGLFQDLVCKNVDWGTFKRLLLSIIEECPIVLSKNSEKISEIVLKRRGNGDYAYIFSLIGSKDKPIIKLKFK